MQERPKRIQYIDSLKGFAVLLVITGHCWTFSRMVAKFILAFHMPLFFFVSGYLMKHTNTFERNSAEYIVSKFRQLIVPYLCFEGFNLILAFLVRPFYGNTIHESLALQNIILCINTADYEGICLRLWFLPAAFISSLYMLLCVKLESRFKRLQQNYYPVAAAVLFIVSLLSKYILRTRLQFTLDIAVMATAYMCLGFCSKEIIDAAANSGKRVLYTVMIISFILTWMCAKHNTGYFMYSNSYGNYGLAITGSIAGIVMSVTFVHAFKIRGRFFEWLAKNSLIVFPLHLEILFFIKWFLKTKLGGGRKICISGLFLMLYFSIGTISSFYQQISSISKWEI